MIEECGNQACVLRCLSFKEVFNLRSFIDWLCTAKEVMEEFRGVPEEMKVPLIATRLRGRQQRGGSSLR